jgi:hypothetical protein
MRESVIQFEGSLKVETFVKAGTILLNLLQCHETDFGYFGNGIVVRDDSHKRDHQNAHRDDEVSPSHEPPEQRRVHTKFPIDLLP